MHMHASPVYVTFACLGPVRLKGDPGNWSLDGWNYHVCAGNLGPLQEP